MKLGIVDYELPRGGVERFIESVLNSLPEETDVTIFSARRALDGYRALQEKLARPVRLVDKPVTLHQPALVRDGQAGFHGQPAFELTEDLWREQDIVWMPWANRHAIPPSCHVRTVATIHDVIAVELAEFMAAKLEPVSKFGWLGSVGLEDLLMRRLMGSLARIAVDAKRTADHLSKTYGPPVRVPEVIYPANDHITAIEPAPIGHLGLPPRYLIYPASDSSHKNHETLFMALAKVKAQAPESFLPLVLTGANIAAIGDGAGYRSNWLRAVIGHLGLRIGRDVLLMGRLSDGEFRSVLQGAAGLVFPTLAEGFGFPPLEAAYLGVPLAVSDIEIVRETLAQIEAPALLFRAQDADDIARTLVRLAQNEAALRRAIAPCIGRTIGGNWADVGRRYLALFEEQRSMAAMYQSYGA